MEIDSQKFLETLKKYKNILIYIKGSPDPDVLASSYALKLICENLHIKATIYSAKKLSLPQNAEFVKLLDIPIIFVEKELPVEKHEAYIVVDHQSARVDELSDKLVCAVHIDHHAEIEGDVPADFRIIKTTAGSTCTIIALIMKDLQLTLSDETMLAICTALMYGIQTDTDKYDHASHLDYEAMNYLSMYANDEIINKIRGISYGEITISLLGKAIDNETIYKGWLIAGVGFVEQSHRDSIAIVADFLLKREGIATAIVFAAIEDKEKDSLKIDASFRSKQEHLNLNDIIKEITKEGGARKYKGAYQVNIDYFSHCPDRELLWQVIHMTTLEVLKKRRDGVYITEIKGVYRNLKRKLSDWLK